MSNNKKLNFAENVFPLLAPIDSATTSINQLFVDARRALHVTFYIYLGVITGAATTSHPTITVEAATAAASGTNPTAIPFTYRVSAATGTNTWGAITAATATGFTHDIVSGDGKMIAIDVNLASLDGLLADAAFLRPVISIVGGGSVFLNAVWAEIEPRYPQLTQISAAS